MQASQCTTPPPPRGGRHISTEIWQRLSSLFPLSRAFSAFPVFPPFPFFRLSRFSAFPFFPPFPLFRGFLKNKSLCGGERDRLVASLSPVQGRLDKQLASCHVSSRPIRSLHFLILFSNKLDQENLHSTRNKYRKNINIKFVRKLYLWWYYH